MAPKNSSATAIAKNASAQEPKSNISPEKKKALDAIMQKIEKDHGKGAIMRLGDATNMRVETIPSGALPLDLALGGGLPKGRVIEVYGPESSGKTTLVLHAIAEVQKRGGIAAFVDAEHALDPTYAASVGVDINNLLISQPDSGEMALEIVDNLVRSMAVELATRNPNVRVNGILPGPVMLDASISPEAADRIRRSCLLQKHGQPEHVAQAAQFLAEHTFITGVCLPVDGGRTIWAEHETDRIAHPSYLQP
jgi:RecA/RadA recombinase